MWINDPKTKEPSVTLTAFVGGMLVATLKLALSGLVVGTITLAPFTGLDYAAVVGSLGAVYTARRHRSQADKGGPDVS